MTDKAMIRRGPSDVTYGKISPHAREIEIAVIATPLVFSDTIHELMNAIQTEEVFYDDRHQKIYLAMKALYEDNRKVDVLTVTEKLRAMGFLESAGGPFYVTQITSTVASPAHIEDHMRILKQKFISRELIRISQVSMSRAFEDIDDPFSQVADMELELGRLGSRVIVSEAMSVDNILDSMQATVELDAKQGILSGLSGVDRVVGGDKGGQLIITAGRPGSGKTSKMLGKAYHQAKSGIPVLIYSLEMSGKELITRLVSSLSGLPYNRVEHKKFYTDTERNLYENARSEIRGLQLYIDDRPGPTITELRAKTLKYYRLYGIQKVYVDHLSKVRVPKVDKFAAAAIVSGSLKNLAKELSIPVEALCQLSRKVEERGGDMRPILSDLRNAGEIEEDADVVYLLYRPEYYLKQGMGKFAYVELPEGKTISSKNYGEVIIAKHRNGEPLTVPAKFVGEGMRWQDFDGGEDVSIGNKKGVKSSAAMNTKSDEVDDLPF